MIQGNILHTHNVTRKCVENFLGPFEVKNFAKNWQNPEISKPHFGLEKTDFPTFPSFCALSLRLIHRMIANQCALDVSGLGEHLRYQQRDEKMLEEFSKAL